MTDKSDAEGRNAESIGRDELTELERMERVSTQGPWAHSETAIFAQLRDTLRYDVVSSWPGREIASHVDRDLIVALRNAAPRLFAALREAWAERDEFLEGYYKAADERDALKIHADHAKAYWADLVKTAAERDALRAEVKQLTEERNTARRLAAQREGSKAENERLSRTVETQRGLLERCRWAADSFKGNEGLWADLDAALGEKP